MPSPDDGEHLVGGRYRLRGRLGQGGMGVVWRATDTLLNRDVAIKEVRLAAIADPAARDDAHRRTMREARLAAGLHHPGIVTIHDVVTDDDRPWIVMELVDAPSLEHLVGTGGPLPPERAARITLNVLDALTAAHAAGVLHRDIKPANILVLPGDKVVLTDFGIATVPGDTRLTRSGALVGSPDYLAPERIGDRPATEASDIWSLGATLFMMVEGHGPFRRDSLMATLGAIATTTAPEAAHAGPLRPAIAAMLARDPADRPTAEELTAALTGAPAGAPSAEATAGADAPTVVTSSPTLRGATPGVVAKPRPWKAVTAVAAVVVLLAAGLWYAIGHGGGHQGAGGTPTPAPDLTAPPGIADWLTTPTPGPRPTDSTVQTYADPAHRFTINLSDGCSHDDPENLIAPDCLADQYWLTITVDKIPKTAPAAQIEKAHSKAASTDRYIRWGGGTFLGFPAASREFTYTSDGTESHELELIVRTPRHRYDLITWASDLGWRENLGAINAMVGSFRPT